ncbi:MAG: RNA-binding transcriptional accessory protein [Clostridia bacterium]|nr:RNA-binding transcriptional accessory protein [Clostridia bacterium]
MDIIQELTTHFGLQKWQVENTVNLIDEGNTIPFIARYRKEAHGTLDDQVIRELSEKLEYLRNLDKRREEVRSSIEAQEKLTDEIAAKLDAASTLAEIEDIYRPFRPKRKTRASVAREKGLEPLADAIYAQNADSAAPIELAEGFIDPEKGVETAEDALKGALDIIAENISDDADIRRRLRNLFSVIGVVTSTATDKDADSVYTMYYDYSEPVKTIAGHRVLAIDRGEKEKFLKVNVTLDAVKASNVIISATLNPEGSPCTEAVREAGEDAYNRLIYPSIEREIRNMLTENAAASAIKVFALNTKELLLAPPVKGKVVIGLDPGYRTGCKVAVVAPTGKVLDTGVIYVTHSDAQRNQAKELIKKLIAKHSVNCISIGNGTASKETEIFAAEVLREINADVSYMVVSEAGASVYSASKLAAQEFPQFDVSLRSAVSIARRLQDPLAELVKIDPKAIGVGQYQHDMPPKELDAALDGVIEDAVNSVGVDLNTASAPLLSRVSGINATVAKNIVDYRDENGEFKERSQLKKVPKLGAKAFEQCAGFLRVPESKNILDNTGVHPESYSAAKDLLKLFSYSLEDIGTEKIKDIAEAVESLGADKVAEKLGVGIPTLKDIVKELIQPARDPRDELPPPMLRTDVMDMSDLIPGMELKGTVRNVTDFGAFIDIGVHQDGLVHISQITNKFIKHPSEVLKVGQVVTVWVIAVDVAKKRISLTMKEPKSQESK